MKGHILEFLEDKISTLHVYCANEFPSLRMPYSFECTIIGERLVVDTLDQFCMIFFVTCWESILILKCKGKNSHQENRETY